MPKAKRDKKVSLTKTKKKGLDLKRDLIDEIRKCCDSYKHLFVFSVENMRNNKLKEWRLDWKVDSRLFLGKNNVMAVALGRRPEDEYRDGLHQIAKLLSGTVGLLFTNKSKEEVTSFCSEFASPDFARSGFVATQTVVTSPGPLNQFSHALQPHLQQLGMPVTLKKGIITLDQEFTVCKRGKPLTPEQARILKLFGHQMAQFRIHLVAAWSNDGAYEQFKVQKEAPVVKKVVLTGDIEAGAQKMEADSMLDDEVDEEEDHAGDDNNDDDSVVEAD